MNLVTQHQVDQAGDAVERAHMRRGRAQRRYTASFAECNRDAQDLSECNDACVKAETELKDLTEAFHAQRKANVTTEPAAAGAVEQQAPPAANGDDASGAHAAAAAAAAAAGPQANGVEEALF